MTNEIGFRANFHRPGCGTLPERIEWRSKKGESVFLGRLNIRSVSEAARVDLASNESGEEFEESGNRNRKGSGVIGVGRSIDTQKVLTIERCEWASTEPFSCRDITPNHVAKQSRFMHGKVASYGADSSQGHRRQEVWSGADGVTYSKGPSVGSGGGSSHAKGGEVGGGNPDKSQVGRGVMTENDTLKYMAVGSDDFDGTFWVQDMSAGENQPVGSHHCSRTDLDSFPRFIGGDLQQNRSLPGLDDTLSDSTLQRFKFVLLG